MNDFEYFEEVLMATGYYNDYHYKDFLCDNARYYSRCGVRTCLRTIHVYLHDKKIELRIENDATDYCSDFCLTRNMESDTALLKDEIKKSIETKTGWQLCSNGCYVNVQ